MPDLRQALRDFVTTSNSGKYSDEATLLSKFPELQGYSVDALRDFVTTSNSGKYATEDELLSKFPEFGIGATEVKKKEVVLPPRPNPNATDLPLGIGSLEYAKPSKPAAVKVVDETPKEKNYFTGKFGDFLTSMDAIQESVGGISGIGDVIDDIGRSIGSGFSQGAIVTPANKLMLSGKSASSEDVQKYIAAAKESENIGPSDEMMKFRDIYEKEGKGVYGFIKGLAMSPGALPEIAISSFATMLNPTSAATAGGIVGGAAAYGALATPEFGGVGAVPAALGSLPYAMGAANVTLETGLTFGELLQEELKNKGLEFNEENVKKVLEDDKAVSSIRAKSVARGATIGFIDALTGRIAGKVGAKLIGNTAASKVKSGLAATGIEAAGGSTGEAAGRLVAGQEMDIAEIGLEGIGEAPMAPISIAAEVMKKPIFVVNNELVTESDVKEIIDNTPANELHKIKFDIRNDKAGYNDIIQDKIVTNTIREEVRQVSPDIDEETLNQIVDLEKQLQKIEGNKTQSGKDKVSSIRSQIKTLQENVQEQTTGQVPVQSGTEVSGEVAQGEPQAEPQVIAEEGVQEEVVPQNELATIKDDADYVGDTLGLDDNDSTVISLIHNSDMTATEKNILFRQWKRGVMSLNDIKKLTVLDLDKINKGNIDKWANVILSRNQGREITAEDILFEEVSVVQKPQVTTEEGVQAEVVQEEVVAPEVTRESIRSFTDEQLSDAYDEIPINLLPADDGVSVQDAVFDAYTKAKNSGKNPELVSAVEKLVQPEEVSLKTQEEVSPVTEAVQDLETRNKIVKAYKDKSTIELPISLLEKMAEFDRAANPDVEVLAHIGEGKQKGPFDDVKKMTSRENIDRLKAKIKKEGFKGYLEVSLNKKGAIALTEGNHRLQALKELGYENVPVKVLGRNTVKGDYFEMVQNGGKRQYGLNLNKDFNAIPVAELAPVTEAVQEIEQYEPITEGQVSNEKFTKENAIDYEEDTRETDSGREVKYLSRVTVEALDDNTGDVIGGLVKIVDEDKNVSWQAQDVDGNELGKEDFDSLEEAKTALVNNFNKTQKKEFDKEVKRKAKAAEKEAAKKAKAAEKEADKKQKPATKSKQKAASTVEQEGPTEEDLSAIDALLDLDVENEDNMQIVLNALDNADKAISKRLRGSANDALLAIPLSTIQLVVKSLKVLVKGGMILRDAIRKVAADNNVSQQIVKDILNVSEIQEGFDALMVKVDEMIARQTRRGTPEARMVSNIDTLVRNSEVYQNANDAQKKILEREARARAGVSARRAPSIGRILGVLKDITNVSREDKLKIISQIRQLSKDAAKDLAAEIKELAKGGRITANQAANIVARFGKVNMLSEISVSKFVDYMTKVFNDAEYASKLSKAKSTKKELSSLSKNKDKNANLRDLAQQFIKIDPAMVEDIDAYNEMASKIKEAIKGSTIRGQKVSFAETVNIDNATEYINKTLDAQLEAMKAEKAAEIQSLMGIDVSDFSYDDMMLLLESDKPITKYNEGIIRSTINRAFGVFSSIIKDAIRTGKDPFTGEDVKFTESQKDVVERFMAMDLNILKPKEALQAVDALANFLQNQSTAKMEAVVSRYTGIANAIEVNKKGIVASPLKKYFSKTIGRILGEQTTNLNVLFERMFKGFNKGGFVMDKMGLTKLINKKSFAQKQANNIVDDYIAKFYKLKANGEAFNSAYNNIERGMAAFMMRNVVGTEQEMKAEFGRRKNLMEESITALSNGNDKERAKAKLYQQAYDNILKDSENIDDIKKNTDKVNLDGISFWMNEWENKFEQLSDVSENVYNKTLDKDINYTPDRFYKLSSDTGKVEIGEDDSAFLVNSGIGNLYQRSTGVLMTAVRPESLPVNPESGDVNRYIDLSFDNNNSNSMYDALVDINTAAPIRQIQAFLNSSEFKKIVPTSEDAKIIKDRIQLYVRNIRDKNPYSNDELASVVRKLNKIAAIGVGQALGGITQPIKQVIPVAINTLINGGGLDLTAAFNQAKNNFINNSGYAIASRGLESQAQIESLNKLIEEVSETKGEKLMAGIEKLNKWWLDKFLVKPDVYIARASWLTYYEQSLQKQGVDTKDLDYSTHKINEDAANYAQRMVDRQQNVSDTDLAGKLFASRESANQLLVKTLMPFASFRMNQSARLGADLATLTNKTSTKEDKKIALRSAAGFAAEVATFRMVSIGISVLLGSLAKAIMGKEEDDEEKEKRIDNIIKGARTGTFTDIFSPVPIADKLIQAGGALITQSIEDATGLPTAIYSPRKEEFLQNAGLFGIAADRAGQLFEISKLAATGEYTDDFGKEKTISSDDQEGLSFLIPAAILTNIGLAPSEVNSVVRYAIKDSKKKSTSQQEKGAKAERKADTEDAKKQKLDAFENVKQETSDPKVLNAIDERIKELNATSEQKKQIEKKNKAERVLKQSLLVDPETGEEYDTETEMKRYNKDLWEKNFGENSDWYQSHEAEKEATKLLNKEIRKMEDEEYNYVTPTRKPKRARNSDGTFKRKRREL